MEHRLQGRGMTEADQKRAQFEAEREQITKLKLNLEFKNEQIHAMNEELKIEEGLAREQLDAKIQFEQDMETLSEDADAVSKKRADNRLELIAMQIKHSQLKAANEKAKEELDKLSKANEELIKNNTVLDEKNTKLDEEIVSLNQRVNVNTLLKEVDLEELKLLAQNTEAMNQAYKVMLHRWEKIRPDQQ